MIVSATSGAPRTDLDARYGRTRGSRRRQRWVALICAVLAATAVIAWLVWINSGPDQPTLDTRGTGSAVISDTEVLVRYEVAVDPGTAVRCAVQAVSQANEVVGWKVVDVPASQERIRAFVERVNTMNRASTGLLYRCWLP